MLSRPATASAASPRWPRFDGRDRPEPTDRPLDDAAFATLMERLGGFEPAPRLAVGVSGGADSLALLVLCKAWADARGGEIAALTVDHRLRPEAAEEARRVAGLCRALRIAHDVLRLSAPPSGRSLQAAAREARYRVLARWCREQGVLHLAVGHHREDQVETFLLRLGEGSGPEGLAAMAPERWLADVRLLRPLLSVPAARLRATLVVRGLEGSWIEDPSNCDTRFTRVRLREILPPLSDAGVRAEDVAASAAALGRWRAGLEAETARLLVEACRLDPLGFAWLDLARLRAEGFERGQRALGALVRSLGGRVYAPRRARLERAWDLLRSTPGRAITLGGCRLVPGPERPERLLVARELRGIEPRVLARSSLHWDGRFEIRPGAGGAGVWRIVPLGSSRRALSQARRAAGLEAVPPAALAALPALERDGRIGGTPALPASLEEAAVPAVAHCRFRPCRPMATCWSAAPERRSLRLDVV